MHARESFFLPMLWQWALRFKNTSPIGRVRFESPFIQAAVMNVRHS